MTFTIGDIMKMLDGLGVVIVCAAHNDFQEIKNDSPGIPDRFAVPDEGTRLSRNMVMVGGTDAAGRPGSHSPWLPWMVMAPGYMTWVADAQGPESYRCGIIGNSYGKLLYPNPNLLLCSVVEGNIMLTRTG